MTEREAEQWAMGAHLSTFAGFIFPFGNLLAPFIIWQVKKGESELVDDQAREALNFQITITLIAIVCAILVIFVIGAFLLPLLGLVDVVLTILAALQANEGVRYRYPFCLRLI